MKDGHEVGEIYIESKIATLSQLNNQSRAPGVNKSRINNLQQLSATQ